MDKRVKEIKLPSHLCQIPLLYCFRSPWSALRDRLFALMHVARFIYATVWKYFQMSCSGKPPCNSALYSLRTCFWKQTNKRLWTKKHTYVRGKCNRRESGTGPKFQWLWVSRVILMLHEQKGSWFQIRLGWPCVWTMVHWVPKRMAYSGLLKQLILWWRVIYITYYKFVFLSKWSDLYLRTSGSLLNFKFSWILILAILKMGREEDAAIRAFVFCLVYFLTFAFIVIFETLGVCHRRFYEK